MNHMLEVYSVAKVLLRLVQGRKFCSLRAYLLLKKNLVLYRAVQTFKVLESENSMDILSLKPLPYVLFVRA